MSTSKDDVWFKLDNAAKLFPSIATYRCTTVFRISATLYKTVNTELLQLALNHLITRLPYFQVNLKRGFFWYYLEKTNSIPQVIKENDYPCMYLSFRSNGHFPFRILYYKNRIALEMAHFLTDGTGAMVFLKSLLVEYFKLLGVECSDTEGILTPDEAIETEEYQDAFKKIASSKISKVDNLKTALHFPFPLVQRGCYHIVTGIMPVKSLLKLSKSYGVTLNTFFVSLFFKSIFDYYREYEPEVSKRKLQRPVVMNIPVNLRGIFPSKTMCNFFLSITASLDFNQGAMDFERILKSVAEQLNNGLDKNNLAAAISRNVKSEASLIIRLLPLSIKDALMPLVYLFFGENGYTTSISNVGKVSMPGPIDEYIERFEFYPPPSRGNKIKTTLVSYKDKLYFSFGKLTKENVIERIFFRNLIKMGIPVKIETSY